MVENQILKELLQMKDMSVPDNIASLQIFLGLAYYYHIFISNMHDLRAPPLSELLKKRQSLSLDCRMPEGISKNQEKKTDVRPISYPL